MVKVFILTVYKRAPYLSMMGVIVIYIYVQKAFFCETFIDKKQKNISFYVRSIYILHSYKRQPLFVSLRACLRHKPVGVPKEAACPAPVAHASHTRTLINVNPFSCL